MNNENPEVVNLVSAQLPITSFALHPNVSGESFLLPTSLAYTGAGYLIDRHPGAVYLYAPGQSIVITYGETKESAQVNKFAEVLSEDLSGLRAIGKAVYDATLSGAQYSAVSATVRSYGDNHSPSKELSCAADLTFDGGWRSATAIFSYEASRALCNEPDEVLTCFAGIIPSGMGTGGNIFPVWMHQWCYLMTDGPNTLYRFLTDVEIPNMTLPIIVELTRNHLLRPFNHFEFLSDLGLNKFRAWGHIYSVALDDLGSLEEYKLLTTALLTLVNFYHRRVQARFPFYLGKSFPRISRDEILKISRILEISSTSTPSSPYMK
ncbi:hypothetical protein G6L46_30515 [Agrobacterium rhizogenes]|uniref:cucumopine synthase-related protein n=1 Tax=Rhizobium rhizogenes TaxID=359 RepID=UPI001571CD5E|nr:hypothetical protein [Rhizobium rhizogenes]NTF91503.1 hypothetical protein [Rhizobium rhizogenes]